MHINRQRDHQQMLTAGDRIRYKIDALTWGNISKSKKHFACQNARPIIVRISKMVVALLNTKTEDNSNHNEDTKCVICKNIEDDHSTDDSSHRTYIILS